MNPPHHHAVPVLDRIRARIGAVLRVHRGEEYLVLCAVGLFVLIMCGYYVVRPVREAMGISRGWETLPWLNLCTVGAVALLYPAVAWLFSRWPRRWALTCAMGAISLSLVGFYTAFLLLDSQHRVGLGYVFYVWLSMINLLLVSLYWSLLNEACSAEQSRRLFPLVAAGGTLGAICGAGMTSVLSDDAVDLHHHHFMLISAAVLACATALAWMMASAVLPRAAEKISPGHIDVPHLRPDVLSGLKTLRTSPLARTIGLYLFIYALTSTLLYFAQGKIIDQSFESEAARRAAFANLDLFANLLALFCQVFLTSRLVSWIGVGKTLLVTPLLTLIGLTWISRSPTLPGLTFAQITRRGLHYAIDRPPREALYGVLSTDAKYKTKQFIDTVVYRAGDLCGMLAWTSLVFSGVALMWVAAPVIIAWMALGLRAGTLYTRDVRSNPR